MTSLSLEEIVWERGISFAHLWDKLISWQLTERSFCASGMSEGFKENSFICLCILHNILRAHLRSTRAGLSGSAHGLPPEPTSKVGPFSIVVYNRISYPAWKRRLGIILELGVRLGLPPDSTIHSSKDLALFPRL